MNAAALVCPLGAIGPVHRSITSPNCGVEGEACRIAAESRAISKRRRRGRAAVVERQPFSMLSIAVCVLSVHAAVAISPEGMGSDESAWSAD